MLGAASARRAAARAAAAGAGGAAGAAARRGAQRGDVPLDQSISLYERGEALRAACQQRLDAAQARIEKIVTGADGRAGSTQAFDAGN